MPPKRTSRQEEKSNPTEDRPVPLAYDSDDDNEDIVDDSSDKEVLASGDEGTSKESDEKVQPMEGMADVDPNPKSQVSGPCASVHTPSPSEESYSPLFPDGRSLVNFMVDLNLALLRTVPPAGSTSAAELEAKISKSQGLKSPDNEEGSDSKSGGSKSPELEREGSKSSDKENSDSKSEESKSPDHEGSGSKSGGSKSPDNEGSDSKSGGSKSPDPEGPDRKSKGQTSAENEVPEAPERADLKRERSKSPEPARPDSERSSSSEDEPLAHPEDENVVPHAQVDPDEHQSTMGDRISRLLIRGRGRRRRLYEEGPGPVVLERPIEPKFVHSDDSDDSGGRRTPSPPVPVEPEDYGQLIPYFFRRRDGTVALEEDFDVEDGTELIDDALLPYDDNYLRFCRVPMAGPDNEGVLVPFVHPGRRRVFVHLDGPITLRHYAFLSINAEMCDRYERIRRLTEQWAGRTVDIGGAFRPALDRYTAAFIDMQERGDPVVPDAATRLAQLGSALTDCDMIVQRNRNILEYVLSFTDWIKDMYEQYVFPNRVIEADNTFPERFEELLGYLERAQSNLTLLPTYVRIFNAYRHVVDEMFFEEQ